MAVAPQRMAPDPWSAAGRQSAPGEQKTVLWVTKERYGTFLVVGPVERRSRFILDERTKGVREVLVTGDYRFRKLVTRNDMVAQAIRKLSDQGIAEGETRLAIITSQGRFRR